MRSTAVLLLALIAAAPLGAGELSRRQQLALERALSGGPPRYDLDFLLADLIPQPGRRFTQFSGDLSGRYLEALAASGQLGQAEPLLQRIFDLQRPDGGFADPLSAGSGVTADDMARVWGHGRLLAGLLAAYRAGGDDRALEAARRLGDFLVEAAPRFLAPETVEEFAAGHLAHGYICWTQNLEGLVDLDEVAGESVYLDVAREIVERLERRPGQHSHGWLTSLRGLVALSEAADEEAYLGQAEEAWERLTASENVLLTGTVPEYFAPGIARDEGCAEADWVRLNLALWRRTENERYLEAAERALFNAFFLNQFASGDFGHVQLAEDGLGYGATRAWWCCTLHGLRAFPAIRDGAFRTTPQGLRYELPVDGEGAAAGLRLRADAELAREAAVRFEVLEAPSNSVRLSIRRPAWSGPLQSELEGEASDEELVLERIWRQGERFSVRYAPLERPEGASLLVGPWITAVSESASPSFFDEPHEGNRLLWETLRPAGRPSRRQVDYVPAGYPQQIQTVTLRPVAERLEIPEGLRWQWSFRSDRSRLERTAERIAEQSRGRTLPFAAGLLLGAVGVWLWRRRRPDRSHRDPSGRREE